MPTTTPRFLAHRDIVDGFRSARAWIASTKLPYTERESDGAAVCKRCRGDWYGCGC